MRVFGRLRPRSIAHAAMLLWLSPIVALAQPKAPATAPAYMGATNVQGPSTVTPAFQLGREFVVDLPAGWLRPPGMITDQAFAGRSGTLVFAAVRKPGASQSSAMPYGLVEQWYPEQDLGSVSIRRELAERIAEYYKTAVNPPCRADRPPSWRKAKVTPIRFDPTSARFSFEATETYDPPLGEAHVYVVGQFDRERILIFSIWADAENEQASPGEARALRDSFRMVDDQGDPLVTAGQSVRRTAQLVVGIGVLAVVVIQIVVLVRERRAKRGEAVEQLF